MMSGLPSNIFPVILGGGGGGGGGGGNDGLIIIWEFEVTVPFPHTKIRSPVNRQGGSLCSMYTM